MAVIQKRWGLMLLSLELFEFSCIVCWEPEINFICLPSNKFSYSLYHFMNTNIFLKVYDSCFGLFPRTSSNKSKWLFCIACCSIFWQPGGRVFLCFFVCWALLWIPGLFLISDRIQRLGCCWFSFYLGNKLWLATVIRSGVRMDKNKIIILCQDVWDFAWLPKFEFTNLILECSVSPAGGIWIVLV